MKVRLLIFLFAAVFGFAVIGFANIDFTKAMNEVSLDTTEETFYRGEITEIISEGEKEYLGNIIFTQELNVKVLTGQDKGKEVQIEYRDQLGRTLAKGDLIVLVRSGLTQENPYEFFERYRLNALYLIFGVFLIITLLIAGKRGITSLLGLFVSLFILTTFIVPKIVEGSNPLFISFFGALIIATLSLFMAHGINKRTSLALASTLITLCIALLTAILSVSAASLFGMGSEEAVSLTMMNFQDLNLKGLLLAAIIIGVLGILDDVTTTQTAAVEELSKANANLSRSELLKRGLSVGKEHITSLINTLVIAYAGASLPIFLILTTAKEPFWIILNNEFLAEEVVRTLVGSLTLIIAVPISTFIAAYFYAKSTSSNFQKFS